MKSRVLKKTNNKTRKIQGGSTKREKALKILELDSSASDKNISTAYKKLALKYHPDKTNGDDTMFKKITSAHDYLTGKYNTFNNNDKNNNNNNNHNNNNNNNNNNNPTTQFWHRMEQYHYKDDILWTLYDKYKKREYLFLKEITILNNTNLFKEKGENYGLNGLIRISSILRKMMEYKKYEQGEFTNLEFLNSHGKDILTNQVLIRADYTAKKITPNKSFNGSFSEYAKLVGQERWKIHNIDNDPFAKIYIENEDFRKFIDFNIQVEIYRFYNVPLKDIKTILSKMWLSYHTEVYNNFDKYFDMFNNKNTFGFNDDPLAYNKYIRGNITLFNPKNGKEYIYNQVVSTLTNDYGNLSNL